MGAILSYSLMDTLGTICNKIPCRVGLINNYITFIECIVKHNSLHALQRLLSTCPILHNLPIYTHDNSNDKC